MKRYLEERGTLLPSQRDLGAETLDHARQTVDLLHVLLARLLVHYS
jgi:hypothetical protein